MTKDEVREIIAQHDEDESNFAYRDITAEIQRLKHLSATRRAAIIAKIRKALKEMEIDVAR